MGKNNGDEFRSATIEKLSGPDGRSASEPAEEVGVAQRTLSRCLR